MRTKKQILNFPLLLACLALAPGLLGNTALAGDDEAYLQLQWERTWNHKLSDGSDAWDVATSLAVSGDSIYVFGYAQSPTSSAGFRDDSFLTQFSPEGDVLMDGTLAMSSQWDEGWAVNATGDFLFLAGEMAGLPRSSYLSVFDTTDSSYTSPIVTGSQGQYGGEDVGPSTAHESNLYVQVDENVITRTSPYSIDTWTHEIHLRKYDSTPTLVWDVVLVPEVQGIIRSDETGLYVFGRVIQDYIASDPPSIFQPVFLTKFNFEGSVLWQRQVGQWTPDRFYLPHSMAIGADAIYLASTTGDMEASLPTGVSDVTVQRLDKLGNEMWSETYDVNEPLLDKWEPTVEIGSSAIFVAAGLTVIGQNTDIIVFKVGFDGTLLATDSWGGGSSEYPQDAAVIGDDIYVAVYTRANGDASGYANAALIKFAGRPLDGDSDGVLDHNDICLNTAVGSVVNGDGCSINDLCPCENNWKNHGAYLKCISDTTRDFTDLQLIDVTEHSYFVSQAATTSCGNKK